MCNVFKMSRLLSGRPFRYLISGYEYDQSEYPGPPRSVPRPELQEIFGHFARMEVLDVYDETEVGKKKFGLSKLTRVVVLLTPLGEKRV